MARDKRKEAIDRFLEALMAVALAPPPGWFSTGNYGAIDGIFVCRCTPEHGVLLASSPWATAYYGTRVCPNCKMKYIKAPHQELLLASLLLGGWTAMKETAKELFENERF